MRVLLALTATATASHLRTTVAQCYGWYIGAYEKGTYVDATYSNYVKCVKEAAPHDANCCKSEKCTTDIFTYSCQVDAHIDEYTYKVVSPHDVCLTYTNDPSHQVEVAWSGNDTCAGSSPISNWFYPDGFHSTNCLPGGHANFSACNLTDKQLIHRCLTINNQLLELPQAESPVGLSDVNDENYRQSVCLKQAVLDRNNEECCPAEECPYTGVSLPGEGEQSTWCTVKDFGGLGEGCLKVYHGAMAYQPELGGFGREGYSYSDRACDYVFGWPATPSWCTAASPGGCPVPPPTEAPDTTTTTTTTIHLSSWGWGHH